MRINRTKKRRKGVKRKMPVEMLREYIGKECVITMFNDLMERKGTILAIEENWIKIEEKKKISILNGDMIHDIAIAK